MSKCFAIAVIAILTCGCLEKENLYNPEPLPPASDFPDFNLRGEVQLSVNYNVPGFKAFIEIYDEDPVELKNASYVKKEGVTPKYAVFADNSSKFEGAIYIPTAMKKAYLYTEHWGLPMCVKMEATANRFVYDATKQNEKVAASPRKLTGVTLAQLTNPSPGSKYFNPYIIIGSYQTANRKEVHLPKYSVASAADQSLIGTFKDIYYVDKSGSYPFAIEIPKMQNSFILADERKRIDDNSQYPLFKSWAENNNNHTEVLFATHKIARIVAKVSIRYR